MFQKISDWFWSLVSTKSIPQDTLLSNQKPNTVETNEQEESITNMKTNQWDSKKSAVIVCDLWDKHWCIGANERMDEFILKTNYLIQILRSAGYVIIHCPANCMSFYQDHPCRIQTMEKIKNQPIPNIQRKPIPPVPLPQGTTAGCMDHPPCNPYHAWSRENSKIDIQPQDYIGDGVEPIQLLKVLGIQNVIVTGVHANICILDRDYGTRALVSQGFTTVFVSDLTDVMYDDPNMTRQQAIQTIVQFIKTNVCFTMTSQMILAGFL